MSCYLVSKGVPFDVAFALEDYMKEAFFITFANFDRPKDQQFNFNSWRFNEGKK